MVAAVTVATNNIADVALAAQSSPGVAGEYLCTLRRHDPDNPTDGLLIHLVQLDPTAAGSMESGRLETAISARTGSGPESTTQVALGEASSAASSPTLARLLASRSASELLGTGGPADFAGDVGQLPPGLTLQTTFEVYTRGAREITFSNGNPIWVIWGALYGQDFADGITTRFEWQSV